MARSSLEDCPVLCRRQSKAAAEFTTRIAGQNRRWRQRRRYDNQYELGVLSSLFDLVGSDKEALLIGANTLDFHMLHILVPLAFQVETTSSTLDGSNCPASFLIRLDDRTDGGRFDEPVFNWIAEPCSPMWF